MRTKSSIKYNKRELFFKGAIIIEKELNSIEIGNRIKQKLNELKIKQIDLSINTGISKNAISNYISGNRIPDTKSIYLIANFLNISIEWILIGKEESKNLSDEEINLLQRYKILTERNKGKIENYIEERIAEQENQYTTNSRDLA